jgi:hypothetical protein
MARGSCRCETGREYASFSQFVVMVVADLDRRDNEFRTAIGLSIRESRCQGIATANWRITPCESDKKGGRKAEPIKKNVLDRRGKRRLE